MLRSAVHVERARPIHFGILIAASILSLASIAGGVYGLYKGSLAGTSLDFLGAHLKTTHVGMAFAGVGLITFFLSARAVLKNLERLAVLPRDR